VCVVIGTFRECGDGSARRARFVAIDKRFMGMSGRAGIRVASHVIGNASPSFIMGGLSHPKRLTISDLDRIMSALEMSVAVNMISRSTSNQHLATRSGSE